MGWEETGVDGTSGVLGAHPDITKKIPKGMDVIYGLLKNKCRGKSIVHVQYPDAGEHWSGDWRPLPKWDK